MCLFPRLIKNKRYLPNKKNGGIPPICDDYRKLYVPVGCGVCIECMKQKARSWKIRLSEEIKTNQYKYYVTMSFSPDALKKLMQDYGINNECNAIAGFAIRRFLERWRKKHKKSLRHFFITELGHENSERIHLHGIVFSDFEISKDYFESIWQYGNVRFGDYCNLKTINYIAKYITKIDKDHKQYRPDIFCSPGIGKAYTEKYISKIIHKWNDNNTNDFFRFDNGVKCNMPIYYRNKFFTEEQREKLWVKRLDEDSRYILGIKIDKVTTIEGEDKYFRILKRAQEKNLQLGYGDNTQEWRERDYNVTRKMMMKGGD